MESPTIRMQLAAATESNRQGSASGGLNLRKLITFGKPQSIALALGFAISPMFLANPAEAVGVHQPADPLLASGRALRLLQPPDVAATTTDIRQLHALQAARDANVLEQISYRYTEAPAYLSNEIGKTYYTTFSGNEEPISEGGQWLNGKKDGLMWSDIRKIEGRAVGTNNFAKYSDPTAILKGSWGPNQIVEATVYRKYDGVPNDNQEVELRLRSTMRANWSSGYEILFRAYDKPVIVGNFGKMPHFAIVKWKGPRGKTLSDFQPFLAQSSNSKYAIRNNDKIKASIIGNVITVYKNGVKLISVRDNSPFTTGNPGIGFNYNCNGHYEEFGFHDFKATAY